MKGTDLIDKQISKGLEGLNASQKKAVLSVVQAFAAEEDKFEEEIDRRIAEYERGSVKTYTLEESAARAVKAYNTNRV